MAALIAVLVLSVAFHLAITSARSQLSEVEWQNLRERLLRRASVETREPSPEPPPSEIELEAPELPTRLPIPEMDPALLDRQREAYEANSVKSVMELQPFRQTTSLEFTSEYASVRRVSLVNLNPVINSWYVLTVAWADGRTSAYHVVNNRPKSQDLTLENDNPDGLTIVDSLGKRSCDLWSEREPLPLASADQAAAPYLSLCDEEINLRLPVPGRRTTLEWATDFLRDNVWQGEQITTFVRQNLFQDAYLDTSVITRDPGALTDDPALPDGPGPARLDIRYQDVRIGQGELGLSVEDMSNEGVVAGRWNQARSQPGVYVSVVRPDLIDADIFAHHRDVVSQLDEVEREALVYLVAFDLSRFELGFAVGTEHPRVDWSERVLSSVRDGALPGPDGIGNIAPLVATGIVPRSLAERTVATFTGGFKRGHGAFRVSDLASRNYGSHYGFVENGAILSKLQPGLATLFGLDDGRVDMKTWAVEDDVLLQKMAFARQNGLPIIETDPETGGPVPGRQVSRWAAGNWSGSQDRKFRTVRAGTAIQDLDNRRFLIYAYFSSATPSAMARVFEAYGCRYAMLLDMNALEHTYMALYHASEKNLDVEHLVKGMEVLDKSVGDQILPRFLGFADNRDFFYVIRRANADDFAP